MTENPYRSLGADPYSGSTLCISGSSGLFDTGAKDERVGAYDAGASPGQRQTGYAVGGLGIYRKHFDTPKGDLGARTEVYFEGCYQNCEIMLNGELLGAHPYGYTSFSYDMTELLAPHGGKNVLAVRVNNTGANSRWYSGSGLYRPVSLITHPPVHVSTWGGVYVTTPDVMQGRPSADHPNERKSHRVGPKAGPT